MLKPKGLTPASLQIWPLHGRCVGGVPTLSTLILTFTLNAWCIMPTHADTVYRCGEAYSTSSQCANATATEVKPPNVSDVPPSAMFVVPTVTELFAN